MTHNEPPDRDEEESLVWFEDDDEEFFDEMAKQEMDQSYSEFSEMMRCYKYLIDNEIDQKRIDLLEKLMNFYAEDNK